MREVITMFYTVRAPWILTKLYPNCLWRYRTNEKVLYLTFDDGPHPEASTVVLDLLKKYDAKGTFFCIGKNVAAHPEIYRRMLDEGHRTGNHTYDHLNGWKVPDQEYIDNILEAEKLIDSTLFRPPYGRITKFQIKLLTTPGNKRKTPFQVTMWDILSGDFDTALNAHQCAQNVIRNARTGSIITFHDSARALPRMQYALEQTLITFKDKGYKFDTIPV